MKKNRLLIVALGTTLLSGCATNTGTGILAGGASGAALGGIIGGGEGALIGGAAGIIAGGLIGGYLDNEDQKRLEQESPKTYHKVDQGEKLSLTDIIHLSKAKIPDDKIIDLIKKTDSHYLLNPAQIDLLREEGVSKKVIDFMILRS